jgi:hypothetical protein
MGPFQGWETFTFLSLRMLVSTIPDIFSVTKTYNTFPEVEFDVSEVISFPSLRTEFG